MTLYAADTAVSAERSEAEIKRTLLRYGADDIVTGQSARQRAAFVQFHYKGLPVSIRIALPDPNDKKFQCSPSGRRQRNEHAAVRAWESACRQQWRALLLIVKANLEAVENGLFKPQEAFLPWLMLPNGQSVAECVAPRLQDIVASGGAKLLLASFGGQTEAKA